MEDYEIIERLKLGDSRAIDDLYNKYALKAVRTASLITSDSHMAEDVFQEAFIQCIRSINTLKDLKAFKPWFYRILTRTAWKYAKKNTYTTLTDDVANTQSLSVSDEYFTDEKYDLLYSEINKLNIKLKTTIILFYFNEMTIKEIAKTMGCLEGTVKSRLFNAKNKLKRSLNREEFI